MRSWWLSAIPTTDAGRPGLAQNTTIFIVESWQPPLPGTTTRAIHVYTNAASVRLELNGQPVGTAMVQPWETVNFTVPYV